MVKYSFGFFFSLWHPEQDVWPPPFGRGSFDAAVSTRDIWTPAVCTPDVWTQPFGPGYLDSAISTRDIWTPADWTHAVWTRDIWT